MSGEIVVVGLGPGPEDWLTPEVRAELARCTDLVGYGPYVERIKASHHTRHESDNREELSRAKLAFELALAGKTVAVVSGGDPGVFAMAAAVFEALEAATDPRWREVPIKVCPGVSAMHAAAARLGAPLGHDFCAINLSDNLKPWDVVVRRLKLAAEADFVIALYNPTSKARPWQLGAALDALRDIRQPSTPIIFGQAVGRPDEHLIVTTLGDVDPAQADMRTVVLIGSSQTRIIPRQDGTPWVYTPRSYAVGA